MSIDAHIPRRRAEVSAKVCVLALVLLRIRILVLVLLVLELFLLFLLVALVFPVRGGVLGFVACVGACEGADDGPGCAVACFASEGVAAKGACCTAGEAAHDTSIAFRVAGAVVLVLVALVVGVAVGVERVGGGGGILLVLRRGLHVAWASEIML